MKFAMIGAGAMGLRYGILLQEAGNDVTFIDTWQPHIDKIREQGGVYVSRDHKDRHLVPIKLETPETYQGDPDMLIFFTKQMQLAGFLERCEHFFNDKQYAFTCMNGMGHIEKLQQYFADDKIIAGTALIATVLNGPGDVDFMGKRGAGKMNMANLTEKPDEMTHRLFDELEKAQMHPTLTTNFKGTLMTKVIFNSVINTLCTMFEIPMGELGNFEKAYDLGRQLIDEAYDICARADITLVSTREEEMHALDINTRIDMPLHYPSMYQDMIHDRPIEVDYINGYIAKLGWEHHYEAKTHIFLTNLVHLAEYHRANEKKARDAAKAEAADAKAAQSA
ncbi:2-dehydropantoate 2-reductase [Secundilactobacillus sp. HBUAS58055]|uniref:ketopantoate reductase family protein n=1 Tax=Secundilactobacillus angelensis TaxID=2722706 RepID=UPI001F118A6C|nr:2-dehydropantoate 2-reductase [Secundilactobacillus angelensis]MCH5462019.1 2-dehydropantoate 2-reductase [Secundilactobacillus angelensis]